MLRFFFIIALVTYVHRLEAQDIPYTPIDNIGRYPADLIIKFAPLSLVELRQTIQFAVEYKVKPRITFQNELGFMPTHFNIYLPEKDGHFRNFRTRFESRFYFRDRHNFIKGWYVAPEVFYIHSRKQQIVDIGRNCIGGGCAYFERKEHFTWYNIAGYHFKVGYQPILYNKVLLDLYLGLGVRHVFIHKSDEGLIRNEFNNGGFTFFAPERMGLSHKPSVSLGLKVGYLIK